MRDTVIRKNNRLFRYIPDIIPLSYRFFSKTVCFPLEFHIFSSYNREYEVMFLTTNLKI